MTGYVDSTTTPTTKLAKSDAVKAKAKQLAVRYEGSGRFVVASGTTIGQVYYVQAAYGDDNPENWTCDCTWSEYNGSMCSHVRAADRVLARFDRAKAQRRTARPQTVAVAA